MREFTFRIPYLVSEKLARQIVEETGNLQVRAKQYITAELPVDALTDVSCIADYDFRLADFISGSLPWMDHTPTSIEEWAIALTTEEYDVLRRSNSRFASHVAGVLLQRVS